MGWYWLWQHYWPRSFLCGTLASEQCSQQTAGMLTKKLHLHPSVSGSPPQKRHKSGHLQNGAVQTRSGVWVQRMEDRGSFPWAGVQHMVQKASVMTCPSWQGAGEL